MSDERKKSLYQLQKTTKPKVEEIIHSTLEGERKQNALDFVAFLKSLRMTPQWASANSWALNYKNKRVCYIKVGDQFAGEGSWYIRPSIEYNDALIDFCLRENLQNIMLDSVHFCHAWAGVHRVNMRYSLERNLTTFVVRQLTLNFTIRILRHWIVLKN